MPPLPFAVRVRSKIINIIREEMNLIGGQEVLLPTMHPADIWQRSGRWETMEDVMFRLTDHKGAVNVLAVTHEEIFALLAQELNSHKQLPQVWYQFQTKFRTSPGPVGRPVPGPRVHHEGLLQLRSGPSRAGRGLRPAQSGLPADLRAAGHSGHPGGGIQRRHGRQ